MEVIGLIKSGKLGAKVVEVGLSVGRGVEGLDVGLGVDGLAVTVVEGVNVVGTDFGGNPEKK